MWEACKSIIECAFGHRRIFTPDLKLSGPFENKLTQALSCDVIDPNGAIRYDRSMDATQTARSFSAGSLRRYVLDSLAVGQTVSIHTCSSSVAAGLVAIGNEMGARISVQNSKDPERSMIISLESAPGSVHFDLYNMN